MAFDVSVGALFAVGNLLVAFSMTDATSPAAPASSCHCLGCFKLGIGRCKVGNGRSKVGNGFVGDVELLTVLAGEPS